MLLPVAVILWFIVSAWLTGVTAPKYIGEFKTLPYELVNVPDGYTVQFGDITHVAHEGARVNYYAVFLYGSPDVVQRLRDTPIVARLDLAGAEKEAAGQPRFTIRRHVQIDVQPGLRVLPDLEELNVTLTRVAAP